MFVESWKWEDNKSFQGQTDSKCPKKLYSANLKVIMTVRVCWCGNSLERRWARGILISSWTYSLLILLQVLNPFHFNWCKLMTLSSRSIRPMVSTMSNLDTTWPEWTLNLLNHLLIKKQTARARFGMWRLSQNAKTWYCRPAQIFYQLEWIWLEGRLPLILSVRCDN